MQIIFAGTPEFAAAHLQAILDSDHEVLAVFTQPDRPAGRGKKLKPSDVKALALEHNIPVFQPASLKNEPAQQALQAIDADIMVVVAYGLILPKVVLDAPKHGCINVHGSILPKWRGAAPIQRSIWGADKETGVTIMKMDEGLDTGDILSIERLKIENTDTSASLYHKLAELGPKALIRCLDNFASLTPQKQDDKLATHAAKLSKTEALLNWKLSASQLCLNVRAFNPWPVAWFSVNEQPIKVWKAHCDSSEEAKGKPGEILFYDKSGLGIMTTDGVFVIDELQLAGKKPQAVSQLINGQPSLFEKGQVLS